jgi:hypothetical protein
MNVLHKLLLAIIFMMTVGVLFIGYLLLWPVEIIKPNVQPYKVLNENHQVRRGEDLVYLVDACKDREITGLIDRKFVDGIIVSTPVQLGTVKAGCSPTPVTIRVPDKIELGKWHLELYIYYQVNPIRVEQYHFKTENFEVVE